MDVFRKELEQLINKHSKENGSNTPDFILAEFLHNCLIAFDQAVDRRETWYGRNTQNEVLCIPEELLEEKKEGDL